jgi:hypothetical protein
MMRIDPDRPTFLEAFFGEAGLGDRVLAWGGVLLISFVTALSLFAVL